MTSELFLEVNGIEPGCIDSQAERILGSQDCIDPYTTPHLVVELEWLLAFSDFHLVDGSTTSGE